MTINTTENTPVHCHDCHKFADCRQAQNMTADTPPKEGFVYEGDVYCADCLGNDGNGTPYGGKSDCPTHCGGCGVPIIHELTPDGVEYVREELSDGGGCCAEVWPTVWTDYDVEPKIPVDSIAIPERFVELCYGWAGGTDCMLRSVSSTGNLTTGTYLPGGCETEEQWYLTIWRDLSGDVGYARRLASVCSANWIDYDELVEFEDWVDSQVARLEESYGLADWDACDD